MMSLEVRFRQIVSMPAQVNRLVSWIWIGGIVLTAGMVLSILPDRGRIASR